MKIFEKKTRDSGKEFFVIADEHPLHDELRDWAREVHYGILPNDFIFGMLHDVVQAFEDVLETEELTTVEAFREFMQESIDGSYTGEYFMLRTWLLEAAGDEIIDVMRDDFGEESVQLSKADGFYVLLERGYQFHLRQMVDTFPLREMLELHLKETGSDLELEDS